MDAYPERPPATLLRLEEVMRRTGLRRSALYQMIRKVEFPAPIKLGLRASGWIESEIDDWINGRIRQSRAKQPQGPRADQDAALRRRPEDRP